MLVQHLRKHINRLGDRLHRDAKNQELSGSLIRKCEFFSNIGILIASDQLLPSSKDINDLFMMN